MPSLATRASTILLVAALACNTDSNQPVAPTLRASSKPLENVLSKAPAIVQAAVAGRGHRGEQEEMLRLEAKIPGFGGFFRDSAGKVVVVMKTGKVVSPTAVRVALSQAYSTRTEPAVREAMAGASEGRTADGEFSLSELIAIENRIATPRALGSQSRLTELRLGLRTRQASVRALMQSFPWASLPVRLSPRFGGAANADDLSQQF